MQKFTNLTLFPLFLVAYEIILYLSNDAYIPALPEISKVMGVSHNVAQQTFTFWFLGGISVQLLLGPLSDRYGRRPILLIGGLVFIISSAICCFAPNITLLLFGRFFQGAAVPSMIIAGYASIHELYTGLQAIRILAQMQSVTIAAPALGPLIGGLLLTFLNWRDIFGMLVIFGFLTLSILYYKMPETLPPEKREDKFHVHRISKQYFRLLTNKIFIKNIIIICLAIATLLGWMVAGPFLVINQFGFSAIYFGIFQLLIFGSFMLGNIIVRHLPDEINLHKLTTNALIFSLMGATAFLATSFYFPRSAFLMVITLMITMLGVGIISPIMTRLAIESSLEPMGARMSLISISQFAAAAIATSIISMVYNGTMISLASVAWIFSALALLLQIALL